MTTKKPTSFRLSDAALAELDDAMAAHERLYAHLSAEAGLPTPMKATRTYILEQAIVAYRDWVDDEIEKVGVASDMEQTSDSHNTRSPFGI